MCEDCRDEDDTVEDRPLIITPELMRYTREIEADLPGEPVPEDAWPIFFGQHGGGLPWAQYERMARSREAAHMLLSLGQPC